MGEATAAVPLPLPDEDSAPFWEACRAGELRVQRCAGCGRLRFPPRAMCPACRSLEAEWIPLSGRGTIYSRVVCHPPVLPAFRERAPYAVVLVELAEDPALRMLGNVLDCAPQDVEIGGPVRVDFQDVGDGVTLPQWRVAARDAARGEEDRP